jgi:hypothetical protein
MTRTPREVRAIQEQLQLLADRPQLRNRLGYGRAAAITPYADSRRPTADGRMDYRSYSADQDRNYAAGLL